MKIKVLRLGHSATVIEVPAGVSIEEALESNEIPRHGYSISVNGLGLLGQYLGNRGGLSVVGGWTSGFLAVDGASPFGPPHEFAQKLNQSRELVEHPPPTGLPLPVPGRA